MNEAADLKSRLGALKGAYAATRQAALNSVIRWESTDAHRYDLRPYHFELNRQRRGQPVAFTDALHSHFRNGFDNAGRIAVESYFVQGMLVVEFFWRYTPNFAEGVIFYRERPSEIVHANFEERRIVSYRHYDSRKAGRYNHERYTYEGGLLTRITRRVETPNDVAEYDYAVIYGDNGVVDRITLRPNTGYLRLGGVPIIYQRREPIYRPLTDAHEFGRELFSAIVKAVAGRDIREPVCAMILSYTEGEYCPPLIYTLPERVRRDRVGAGEANFDLLWRPDADSRPISVQVPDSVCSMFDGLLPEQAVALLDAVAFELTVNHWTGLLPETYDFVAFALDVESGSAVERIYASAPAEKITLLKDGGWL